MPQQNCFFLYIFALGTLQKPLKSGVWEKETSGRRRKEPGFLPALQHNLAESSPSLALRRAELGFSPDVGVLGDEAQHLQAE